MRSIGELEGGLALQTTEPLGLRFVQARLSCGGGWCTYIDGLRHALAVGAGPGVNGPLVARTVAVAAISPSRVVGLPSEETETPSASEDERRRPLGQRAGVSG